ncbi:MAG: DUF4288 domain-containing protein [Chitinophagaceae bacterium]|nr:DUF4288 domain-containing protein [Chitinophagaceae bacterium]
MNWFLAKIVYRIVCGEGDHTPQFDEQLRLVAATNEKEALHKAYAIGQQEEDCFYNTADKLVQWKFINVTDLFSITEMTDGAEVYSRIEEKDNGDQYTELIHRRAAYLKMNPSLRLLETL